ncbi:MAG: hypothetical protein KJO40_10950 [Deltaproteobacteria bacterium]|nr:hypothetical protein [Deltaproteobacteria bacterium]NND28240.1 hypothetical protein [Myxococcales bacterium]MBT8466262.1 hypothetical protein [Deltaproteobacteria bacterium]MBT8482817.1 hypothetical protein [Deltaproteobacteria bacterium]NNK07136.1 hypothetical protein [Myxococcales bacterium]
MRESSLKLVAWLVAAGVAGGVLALPQPVDPWEMPSLVLDRAAVSDAIALDETLAEEAPDSEEAQALRSIFLDHGSSEANPPYPRREYDRRQAAIHHATNALIERHGEPAFEAMRARAVEEFMEVLDDGRLEAQSDSEEAILGGVQEVFEQYGAVRGNVIVAPPLTLRVFYKARWNSIHRRPFVEGFSRIEKQAYWGWLALHAWGKPLGKREEALLAFRDSGGFGTPEAAALFDVLEGNPERGSNSLRRLYEASGQLRLRNFSLGVIQAGLSPAGSP